MFYKKIPRVFIRHMNKVSPPPKPPPISRQNAQVFKTTVNSKL